MTEPLSYTERFFLSKSWKITWNTFGRLFILLGLSLLGWGLDGLPDFFSHPTRLAFAAVVILQTALITLMAISAPPVPRHELQFELEHWHYSLAEIIYILSAYGDRREVMVWAEQPALRWVGLGIYLAGSAVALWMNLTYVRYLRQRQGIPPENPALLSIGPYRWLRYPALLLLILYAAGVILVFRSWSGAILFFPMLFLIVRRTREMERANAQMYPRSWAARCVDSKRFIPFIY